MDLKKNNLYFQQNFQHTFCRCPSLLLDFSLISHFFCKHFSEILRIILSRVGKCQLWVAKNSESRHHLPLVCDFQHQKQQMTLVSVKCIFMLLSFLVQQDTSTVQCVIKRPIFENTPAPWLTRIRFTQILLTRLFKKFPFFT